MIHLNLIEMRISNIISTIRNKYQNAKIQIANPTTFCLFLLSLSLTLEITISMKNPHIINSFSSWALNSSLVIKKLGSVNKVERDHPRYDGVKYWSRSKLGKQKKNYNLKLLQWKFH